MGGWDSIHHKWHIHSRGAPLVSTRRRVGDKVLPIKNGTGQLLLEVNLSRLVSLNRTGACFPPAVPLVWPGVNAASALGCAPKADQDSGSRPPLRGGISTL